MTSRSTQFRAQIELGTVCVIDTVAPDGKKYAGSGFVFMRPEWVATAKHVIEKDGELMPEITVRFSGTHRKGTALYLDHDRDLAVIRLDQPAPCDTPLQPGDFTADQPFGVAHLGRQLSAGKSAVLGDAADTIERRPHRDTKDECYWFASPHGAGGMSGGPVLAHGGTVLAVVSMKGMEDGTMHLLAASIQPLVDYLRAEFGA